MTFATRRLAATLLAFVLPAAALAGTYPERPIVLIVPSIPGGAADAVARQVAEGLAAQLGKPVIVENRPGGATTIGTQAVARAESDGYTLLLGLDAALAAAPYLLPKLPYRPDKDFAPIGTLATLQYALVASPTAPFHSVDELLARARGCCAGSITYASGGEGSVHHLGMELLQDEAGISLKHVPYKAAPQGFVDVMGGHVDMMLIAPGTAIGPMKAGKVQGLARTGTAPIPEAPALPALSATVKGYVFESWFGLLAPAATPAPTLARLEAALAAYSKTPDARTKMLALGVTPTPEGAATLKARITNDIARYAPVLTRLKQLEAR